MIKILMKHLALSLSVICAVSVIGVFSASAQSAVDHKMSRLERYLKTAEIDVPQAVMSEIKDVHIQIVKLNKIQHEQDTQRLKMAEDSYKNGLEDLKQNSELDDEEELARRMKELLNEYKKTEVQINNERDNSDSHKELMRQQDELYTKRLALIQPYIIDNTSSNHAALETLAKAPMAPTLEAKIERDIALHKKELELYGTPISSDDLQQLSALIREGQLLNEKFNTLLRYGKRDSAEFTQVRAQSKENRRQQSLIIEPYRKANEIKQRAKRRILRELSPPRRAPTKEEKLDRDYKRATEKYNRHNIIISDKDEQAIKRLMKEGQELGEEVARRRLNQTIEPGSIEAHNYKSRIDELERRSKEIMKQYDDQLKAGSKR